MTDSSIKPDDASAAAQPAAVKPAAEPASTTETPPTTEPAIRTIAMPADTNPSGDIFGGWLLSQMDVAGSVCARQRARGRIATVAVEAMKFHKPVLVGDLVSCYGEVIRVGRTSLTIKVESWVVRTSGAPEKVTEGVLT